MKKQLPKIVFENHSDPGSYFEILKVQSLLQRQMDHLVTEYHHVKFFIIFIVRRGKGRHSIDFVDYEYQKGTVLLIRKDQVHKFFANPSVEGTLLLFTEEFIIGHLNRLEALRAMQLFNEALSFPKIQFDSDDDFSEFSELVRYLELERDLKDIFSAGINRSILHLIITKLFRIKAKSGSYVEKKKNISRFLEFQSEVEEHCLNSRKVAFYSRRLGVSPKTLNSIVQDMVRMSAKAFIDERTILQMKRLLISTEYSIKEIAYLVGFTDPTNFYKYFKNLTGYTPEAFRRLH